MITDQQNTGVPSATRGRMQLTKPVQTNNSGLTSPQANAQSNDSAIRAMTSERYNPIQAKYNPSTPNADVTSVNPAAKAFATRPAATTATTSAPEMPTASPAYQPTSVATDTVEELGRQFRGMTEEQQIRFLNNVANGNYNKTTGGLL